MRENMRVQKMGLAADVLRIRIAQSASDGQFFKPCYWVTHWFWLAIVCFVNISCYFCNFLDLKKNTVHKSTAAFSNCYYAMKANTLLWATKQYFPSRTNSRQEETKWRQRNLFYDAVWYYNSSKISYMIPGRCTKVQI